MTLPSHTRFCRNMTYFQDHTNWADSHRFMSLSPEHIASGAPTDLNHPPVDLGVRERQRWNLFILQLINAFIFFRNQLNILPRQSSFILVLSRSVNESLFDLPFLKTPGSHSRRGTFR